MNPINCSALLIKQGTSYCVHLFERYQDSVLLDHCKNIKVSVFDFFVVSVGSWTDPNASGLTESDVAEILDANTSYAENKDKPGFRYSRWCGDRVIMLDLDAKTCGWWNSETKAWHHYE